MGIEVLGIGETHLELERAGQRVHKRSLEVVRSYAYKMQGLARDYAPIKTGALKDSISVGESRTGNERTVVHVYVEPDKLGEGWTKYGFRYDEFMETKYNYMELAALHYEGEIEDALNALEF